MLIETWLTTLSQGIAINHIEDEFVREEAPLFGGTLLQFVGLTLEFVEFLGDFVFYSFDTFRELLSSEI